MTQFRFATVADAAQLAPLNAQLIRDEGHRNPMTEAQLAQRMTEWLAGEYRAVIFEIEGSMIGYALYRPEPDHIYLRQLFVCADHRHQGVGTQAMAWLWQHAWAGTPRVRIDVLIHNATALHFWHAVGFRDYCITMEMDPPAP